MAADRRLPALPDEAAVPPWRATPPPPLPPPPPPARRQGDRAGIVTRLAANTLDAVAIGLVLVGIWLFVAALRYLITPKGFTLPAPGAALVLATAAFVEFVYLALSWTLDGRTYGDEVMGLRVRGRTGPLGFAGATLRAAFCVVFPVGILWVAVSRHNRSVQDVVLRTSVVYDWSRAAGRAR